MKHTLILEVDTETKTVHIAARTPQERTVAKRILLACDVHDELVAVVKSAHDSLLCAGCGTLTHPVNRINDLLGRIQSKQNDLHSVKEET